MRPGTGPAELAMIDSLTGGGGSIARRLLNNKMDPKVLRTCDTLGHEQWVEIDTAVAQAATRRLVGWGDLEARNLIINLRNPLAKTVYLTQVISDMEGATLSISPRYRGNADRLTIQPGYVPLPIIHKDFQYDVRELAASREPNGQPLDTATAAAASRKCAELIEQVLFHGANSFAYGGGTLYGYCDFLQRQTVTLTKPWSDASGVTGEDVLDDVLEMVQALVDVHHFGPYMLYIPTGWQRVLGEDFKAASDKSILVRIKEVANIIDVKIADFLTADNAVLVEMAPESVQGILGMRPQTVEWDSEGGFVTNYKVWSMMVPLLRADQDGNCGICHLS